MTVADRARELGVTEILHYTSERGIMGSVIKGALLSRAQVESDPDVAFIFEGIWERRDPQWVDHISLSVSRINLDLFQRSRSNFPDFWWAVMSFGLEILDDEDVWFTTTNNVYPPCVRSQGLEGFESMFGSPIAWGYHGSTRCRNDSTPEHCPTDRAAEVLYPRRLSLSRLQRLYVPGQQHRRLVNAWSDTYGSGELPIEVNLAPFS